MATALQIISIILSSVALIVTGIGFFASLKFYRDGKRLSSEAEKALARIDERAEDLKSQMGQRFDKTLAAALGDHPGQDETGQMLPSENADEKGLPAPSAPEANGEESPTDAAAEAETESDEVDETFADVQRYMSLRDLRLSTINDSDTQAFYDLGKNEGFNLFEGEGSIVYFGAFEDINEDEIIIRIRNILKNIDLAYENAKSHSNDTARERALEALSNISVEVLMSEDLDIERVANKVNKFKDEFVDKNVHIITVSEMQEEIDNLKEAIVS